MREAVLVDSDVLVDFGRGMTTAADFLARTRNSCDVGISCVTEMELIAGCRDKGDLSELQRYLASYRRVGLMPSIGQRAVELMVQFRLSHGLRMPDALIAATALTTGRLLLTRNRKHFEYIPGLSLMQYPV